MKHLNLGAPLLFLMCLILPFASKLQAQPKKHVVEGNTEQIHIRRLEGCLAQKDAYCYISLWPDMDTLSKIVMEYADKNSKEFQEMQGLQNNATMLLHADSNLKVHLKSSFDSVIATGDAMGIHWESIIPLRYELLKQHQTRNALNEKLAPVRFVGYLFFTDMASRHVYGLMVGNILQIKNEWYGGELRELYEAGTRDEWEDAYFEAHKRKKPGADSLAKDSTKVIVEEEEVPKNVPRIVVERKFYSGMFDNEIAVQLYVRSLKGGCPSGICSWEAIYKFGDQDDYILLEVTRNAEGKWQMSEVPQNAVMDLELKDKVFTGTWTAGDNQTGYDVKLMETPASEKKIQRLDAILKDLKSAR